MARRKPKYPKKNVVITLPILLYQACSEDIENFSAFFSSCLKKHLLSSMKKNDYLKKKILSKYGEDIIYIMRSSKVKAEGTFEDESNLPHMSDEELDALLDEIDNY